MAQAYNKFNAFQTSIGLGEHQLNTDTLNVYLSAGTPTAAMAAKTELAEIATGAGYTGPVDVVNTYAAGTGTEAATGILACTSSIAWTAATAGTFTPFQHVVLYNDNMATPGDSVADGLIGYWSDTAVVSPSPSDTYTVTFANSRIFTLA